MHWHFLKHAAHKCLHGMQLRQLLVEQGRFVLACFCSSRGTEVHTWAARKLTAMRCC